MNSSRAIDQNVLLIGLQPKETELIRKLLSTFELPALPLAPEALEESASLFSEKEICLAVFHIDKKRKGQEREVRHLAEMLLRPVPILLLVPPERSANVREYIQAGADDFSLLPLDADSFAIRFYILLEWGQALLQTPKPVYPWDEHGQQSTKNLWRRLVGRLQEGIGFFSPAVLTNDENGGKIFHKWRKIKKIGSGGFGDVWLVEEAGKGRLAVAKVPHRREMNIRLLRSAAILKRLIHHPNIAGLLEVVKEHGKFILIQEYVDGQTLQQLLERGIGATDKEMLFLQLLAATAYAHQHRIMHRDIKPENILVTGEGRLKLLDFGIARDLSWQQPDTVSEGSLDYMPPEQLRGQSSLASDVWALGVILYIFATGQAPYIRDNSPHPMDVAIDTDIPSPRFVDPRVSPELDRLIMHCLQKDPVHRYTDAIEMQNDLLRSLPTFGQGRIIPGAPWGAWSVG
jgi:hypothetical protein